MALKSCSFCGHTISTLAHACPGCGAPGEAAGAGRSSEAAATPIEGAAVPALTPTPLQPRAAAAHPPLLIDDLAASAPARATATGKALLVIGALAMALLGAMVDSAFHRFSAPRPLAEGLGAATTDSVELQRQITAGLQGRSPEAVAETVRAYQQGASELRALTAMRLTLADVSTRQEMWYAQWSGYASDLDTLRVVPRPGVHVTLTASPISWSASATHDQLPGVTCATGAGGDQTHPGQIICPGEDTLHGRLP